MNFKKHINSTVITIGALGALNLASVEASKIDFSERQKHGIENTKKDNKDKINSFIDSAEGIQNKIRILVYQETFEILRSLTLNGNKITDSQANEIASGLVNEINSSGILERILPKGKPIWITALFALIYIYLYTLTIKKIVKSHHTVSTSSFGGFSVLNGGFAISNGILDAGSLGYISACIMGAITVCINEREKLRIKRGEVSPSMPESIQQVLESKISEAKEIMDAKVDKDVIIKNILEEYVLGEINPVVIYTKEKNDKGFPEESPLFWNPAMEKLTGYSFDEVKHLTQIEILELLYGHDKEEFNRVYKQLKELEEHGIGYKNIVFTVKAKDGTLTQVAWHSEKIKDGGRISFGSCEQAEIQKILRMDRQFDCLNGNTLYQDFASVITQYGPITELDSNNKVMSLIYGDIDDFKSFNTNYGHRIGDVVLSEFIDFIKKELRRKDDNLYRKGGDEFVILCNFVNKEKIFSKVEYIKEHFSRHTIIIEFFNGQMITKRLKHGSYLSAKAYYNANKALNENIKEQIKKHEENLKNNKEDIIMDVIKGRLVLPPISTTWGIEDYNYADVNVAGFDQKTKVDDILERADKAMLDGKEIGKNSVHIA